EIAQVGTAVLAYGHHAAGPAAVGAERGRVVHFDAAALVRTQGDAEMSLRLVGRALAHVVDGPRGVAHAGQQAVRAADHFQLLEAEGVHRVGDHAPAVGQADAVDLGVLDLEA